MLTILTVKTICNIFLILYPSISISAKVSEVNVRGDGTNCSTRRAFVVVPIYAIT